MIPERKATDEERPVEVLAFYLEVHPRPQSKKEDSPIQRTQNWGSWILQDIILVKERGREKNSFKISLCLEVPLSLYQIPRCSCVEWNSRRLKSYPETVSGTVPRAYTAFKFQLARKQIPCWHLRAFTRELSKAMCIAMHMENPRAKSLKQQNK